MQVLKTSHELQTATPTDYFPSLPNLVSTSLLNLKAPRAFNFIHPHMFRKIGTYLLPQVLLQSSLGTEAFKSLSEAWKISSSQNYVSCLLVRATSFDVRAKCKEHVSEWARNWNSGCHRLRGTDETPLASWEAASLLCHAQAESTASLSHWTCTSVWWIQRVDDSFSSQREPNSRTWERRAVWGIVTEQNEKGA